LALGVKPLIFELAVDVVEAEMEAINEEKFDFSDGLLYS
jgi:hypothetical protein